LFAHAEYKIWLTSVEYYLSHNGPKPENSNSRFGLWLANNSPLKQGNYETMLTLHRALHGLAEKLIKQHEIGQIQKARQGLAELHQRYDVLQEKLKLRVEENWM
jgi:sucrose-6-phosphate hydrolase SacC (GH32 family)